MNFSMGFIGAGNMAEAMIKGLKQNDNQAEIWVTNRTKAERLHELKVNYGILPADFSRLAERSNVLIIAVKPKDVKSILLKLADCPGIGNKLVISLAAGIPLSLMHSHLPHTAVIRAMPNTSAAALYAMTGLVQGNGVKAEHREQAEQIFQAIGKTVWIEEGEMNALIALSGSGPAYYYLFTECLIQAGIKLGLTTETAEILAKETVVGVGRMLIESGKSPAGLREAVTSPNGTTFAALEVFRAKDLAKIVAEAAEACALRAEEMEREYGA